MSTSKRSDAPVIARLPSPVDAAGAAVPADVRAAVGAVEARLTGTVVGAVDAEVEGVEDVGDVEASPGRSLPRAAGTRRRRYHPGRLRRRRR